MASKQKASAAVDKIAEKVSDQCNLDEEEENEVIELLNSIRDRLEKSNDANFVGKILKGLIAIEKYIDSIIVEN